MTYDRSISQFFIAYSFFGMLCALVPLPTFISARFIPSILVSVWLVIICLVNFINGIVWLDYTTQTWDGKGYCDVVSRLVPIATVGLSMSASCVSMALAHALVPRATDRRGFAFLEGKNPRLQGAVFWFRNNWPTFMAWLLGLVLPIVLLPLLYIIQPRRYEIFGVMGCTSTTDRSWPSVVIYNTWLLLAAALAIIFGILTMYRYVNCWRSLTNSIRDERYRMTADRFKRLLGISFMAIFYFGPANIVLTAQFIKVLAFDYSWDIIHAGTHVIKFHAYPSRPSWYAWIAPTSGIVILLLFGIGEGSSKTYMAWIPPKLQNWYSRRQSQNRVGNGESLSAITVPGSIAGSSYASPSSRRFVEKIPVPPPKGCDCSHSTCPHKRSTHPNFSTATASSSSGSTQLNEKETSMV